MLHLFALLFTISPRLPFYVDTMVINWIIIGSSLALSLGWGEGDSWQVNGQLTVNELWTQRHHRLPSVGCIQVDDWIWEK